MAYEQIKIRDIVDRAVNHNIRISAKDPMSYINKYSITNEKLSQQFIDPTSLAISHEGYESWLHGRANRLASVGNQFLRELAPAG